MLEEEGPVCEMCVEGRQTSAEHDLPPEVGHEIGVTGLPNSNSSFPFRGDFFPLSTGWAQRCELSCRCFVYVPSPSQSVISPNFAMPKPTPPHSLLHHESLGNTNMKPTYAAALKKPEGNTDSEQAAKKQKTSADGFGSEQHAFAPSTATWVKNAGALKDKIVAATTPKKEKKHKKEKHAKGHKLDQPEKMKESKEIFEAKPLPPIPKGIFYRMQRRSIEC